MGSDTCVHSFNNVDNSCDRETIDKSSFFRPKFVIEYDEKQYPSIFAPKVTYSLFDLSRKYLRIYVKNKGKKKAINTKASLIVIPKNKDIQYPAIKYVQLVWEGSSNNVNTNTTIVRDIQPYGKELLHVIFSDSSFPNIPVNPPTPIHAVISAKETRFISTTYNCKRICNWRFYN